MGVWAQCRRDSYRRRASDPIMRHPNASIVLPLAAILLSGTASASAQDFFAATADSYIAPGTDQNRNFGTALRLPVRRNPLHRLLVRFDEAEIAAAAGGLLVESATLELFAETSMNWGAQAGLLAAHRIGRAWAEDAVTWNCAIDLLPGNSQIDCADPWAGGDFDPAPSATAPVSNPTVGFVSFDVTLDVRAFLAGEANHGWLVKKLDESLNGRVDFSSREASEIRRPRLRVLFVTVLSTPTPTPTTTPSPTPTETPTLEPTSPPATATATPPAPASGSSGGGSGGGCGAGAPPHPGMAALLLPWLLGWTARRRRLVDRPRS